MSMDDSKGVFLQIPTLWLYSIYVAAATIWVLYSDRVLTYWIDDLDMPVQRFAYKAAGLVLGTAVLLYLVFLKRAPPGKAAIGAIFRGEHRIRILLISFLTLLFGAIIANLIFTLTQARQQVLDNQSATAGKLVQVLEQQTADSINATELALKSSARSMQLLPETGLRRQQVVHDLLESNIRNLPFVRAIWVLDAQGDMIHDSENLPGHYNLSDRDYFRVHKTNPSSDLYIDRPILSKHGVWFIGLSLRITRPDGSFGGVIAAALEPKHFRRFYESIKIGNQGIVSLMSMDGTIMLRVPDKEGAQGRKLQPPPKFVATLPIASAGSYRENSRVDQVKRLYFYRRVADRPLVVLVGLGETEILAPWRATAQSYIAASLAFMLLVAWFCYLALQELHRRTLLNGALAESETALAKAQRLSHTGSWQLDLATMTGIWSDEMYRLFGLAKTPTPPPFHQFLALLHPDDRAAVEYAANNATPLSGELRSNPANGPVRYFYARSSEVRNNVGQVIAITGTLQDITERRQADEKLRLAARVFDYMQDGIIVTNPENEIVAVNAAFERSTGYSESEVIGRNPSLLYSDRHDAAFYTGMAEVLLATGEWRGELWSRRKNGAIYPEWRTISTIRDSQGRRTGFVSIFTDLREIKEANAQLEFLSNHDPLTHLPNRRLLNDRLQQAIDAARPGHSGVAVLLLNIDRLQRVNDSFGHAAGDALLQEIAQRLLLKLQPGDTLARPGSDEFVVVLTQFEDSNDVITQAQQLLDAVAPPFQLCGHELSVTAGVGITIYPDDGGNASDLLKNADAALAHAKLGGRNAFRFFTSEMNAHALHWISLEHRLRGALSRNEFSLHYQPQICLKDGSMCSVEALIRWHSPELGTILPADFIPIAEDTGLIVSIGEWVIRTACAQNKVWQDAGLPPISVAVNVSALQFTAGTLPTILRSALAETGLAPQCLEIELTESVLMRETEMAIRQITEFHQMGLRVSLDDFGTGFSSLGYLSRFPLDKLKIDKCFIRNITSDAKSAAIAHATIALARGLGITVIAEGVENEAQLAYLDSAGCDEIQGFFIAKPLPADELEMFQAQNAKSTFKSQAWRQTSTRPVQELGKADTHQQIVKKVS
jgi:diguanylate cyclase (GGDEF)-like protein/PAS domain S-box-containing protein